MRPSEAMLPEPCRPPERGLGREDGNPGCCERLLQKVLCEVAGENKSRVRVVNAILILGCIYLSRQSFLTVSGKSQINWNFAGRHGNFKSCTLTLVKPEYLLHLLVFGFMMESRNRLLGADVKTLDT